MSADIDFTNLSIKDALDLAVLVEEEAEERYRELADNLEFHNTKDAAGFFRFMVTCEAKHGEELQTKRKELFGDEPVSVDRCRQGLVKPVHQCLQNIYMPMTTQTAKLKPICKKRFVF